MQLTCTARWWVIDQNQGTVGFLQPKVLPRLTANPTVIYYM